MEKKAKAQAKRARRNKRKQDDGASDSPQADDDGLKSPDDAHQNNRSTGDHN